jgi:AraC family transcriptional regulator of adaptative response / DNA-3-methyladenine glycosylase II
MSATSTLPFSYEYMLERTYARDKACDGLFLTGVLSTRIYCLPSCPARNPQAKNVRFFATEQEARAAGLRPCRRCRPDHFYQNYDPDIGALASLTAAVRSNPGEFPNVAAMVAASGMRVTKLYTLFREHYDTTPAGFLGHERVVAACRLLGDPRLRITDIAFEVGYESISAFQQNFRKWTGLRPGEYRRQSRSRDKL